MRLTLTAYTQEVRERHQTQNLNDKKRNRRSPGTRPQPGAKLIRATFFLSLSLSHALSRTTSLLSPFGEIEYGYHTVTKVKGKLHIFKLI